MVLTTGNEIMNEPSLWNTALVFDICQVDILDLISHNGGLGCGKTDTHC